MRRALLLAAIWLTATPTSAQDAPVGRTAQTSAGQVGQRRSRETAEVVQQSGRTSSRIQNRVQSRIRNRIDRFYGPQANAVSPFEIAGDQARSAGRPRRR